MKRVKTILVLAMIVLLAGVVSGQAGEFTVSGKGPKVVEHNLTLHTSGEVSINQTLKVTIFNDGYGKFLLYLSGVVDGNEEIVDVEAANGPACTGIAPGTGGCTIFLTNNEIPTADELTVVASGGKGRNPSATFLHCRVDVDIPC